MAEVMNGVCCVLLICVDDSWKRFKRHDMFSLGLPLPQKQHLSSQYTHTHTHTEMMLAVREKAGVFPNCLRGGEWRRVGVLVCVYGGGGVVYEHGTAGSDSAEEIL